jgi:SNF2 family DNA or RNA helicase
MVLMAHLLTDWLLLLLPPLMSRAGHMPMHQRTRAIEAFQKDPPTTVFILTLRR